MSFNIANLASIALIKRSLTTFSSHIVPPQCLISYYFQQADSSIIFAFSLIITYLSSFSSQDKFFQS